MCSGAASDARYARFGARPPALLAPACRRFYIVTYALGIYNLNLFLGFLTPQIDPESEGPVLPSKADEEFRPFVRKLPEFKFWCVMACVCCGLACCGPPNAALQRLGSIHPTPASARP